MAASARPGDGRPAVARVYVRPAGVVGGELAARTVKAGLALSIAGGPLAATLVELSVRGPAAIDRQLLTVGALEAKLARDAAAEALVRPRLDALTRTRPAFAGLDLARPLVMGILNVTPDSFSDGGAFDTPDRAVAHGESLLAAGADILDIGGESTRPGAEPVAPEAEIARVLPVVRHFAERGAAISIDTRHAAVMRAALDAGARIVNDVTALAGDPDSLRVVAAARAPVVLMHMRGDPRTMTSEAVYDDVALDVFDALEARVTACLAAGIPADAVAVDPGIGFAKGTEHNLRLIRTAGLFHGLGVPVLYGLSRKRFIGALSRGEPPRARVAGSLAAGLAVLGQGVQILRVHDVAETVQARALWTAGLG